MPKCQEQTGGDHSVNIQAGAIIQHGLSATEVRQIALDVYRANFERLSGIAAEVATARAEHLVERFLSELQVQNPDGLNQANDPDMQIALLTAEREYARSGSADLADVLVDLLVERTKESGQTLRQIVLNESIGVVSKLTKGQLAALSVLFCLIDARYMELNTTLTP